MSMTSSAGNGSKGPQTWSARLLGAFSGTRSASGGSGAVTGPPVEILPPGERKAAMSTLDPKEAKWSLAAFLLATVAGIAIPAYITADNRVTKAGKNSIAVAPDALLLGGAILLLCIIGFLGLWKRKRTLVAFSLFLIGFGFTLFVGITGFAFILLGGWLMLRAWRLNKYGTTNSKAIAREAAARPRGKDRKANASATAKTPAKTAGSRPTTANKRYTPKSPPRKKIPKPTE
jgi:hypothetical protein